MYLFGLLFSFIACSSSHIVIWKIVIDTSGTVDNFLVLNQRIHDIYWQSLIILLTILIPVSIETLKFLSERLEKLGKAIFFYEVIKIDKFYTLIPFFSLVFIFTLDGNQNKIIDSGVLEFFHALLFFLWLMMFWYLFDTLTTSIKLLADSGDEINLKVRDHLKNNHSYSGNDGSIEKWKVVWSTFNLIRDKWQNIFLNLFWERLNYLVGTKKYDYVTQLLGDFSKEFLSLDDKEKQKNINWINERKRWLWFHEKKFSDNVENPYSMYVRILDLYRDLYKQREYFFSVETVHVFQSGLDQLYRTVKDLVEKLTLNELKETSDSYFGFFKTLRDHTDSFIKSENEDDKEYVANIPIYYPLFESADNYTLQQDSFPNEWRLSAENLENLFKKEGDGRIRLIWLNHFLNWSASRIGHEKKEYDSKLEGALGMLFPEMETSWLAYWIGYRVLSWGGERIESLCHWERNFGFISGIVSTYWYDPEKTNEQNESEMESKDQLLRKKSKAYTAKLLVKLNAFGSKEEIMKMKSHLDSLSSKFAADSNEELNRLQLVDLFRCILEFKKD